MNATIDHPFSATTRAEPHLARRREILARHPEIRTLYGYDRGAIATTAAMVLAQFGIAFALQRSADHHGVLGRWWMVALVAYAIGSVLNHFGGCVIHEAGHNLCARTTLQNRWLGIFANFPIPVPSAMSFRRYHPDHHRYLGIERLDNDLPTHLEVRWVGTSPIRKIVWLIVYPLFGTLARGFLRRPDRWETIGLVVQMAVNVAVVALLGGTAMAYFLWSTFFAYGLHPIAGHFVHEHYQWSKDQETYSYYGALNKVTMNLGYHHEHHDFPAIPGSRLPALHRMAREYYAPLHSDRSWTAVLLRFIRDRAIGHHARFVRTRAVYEASRRSAATNANGTVAS